MPRYFIDTSDGDTFMYDDEGHDLPDPGAARDTAQMALQTSPVTNCRTVNGKTDLLRLRSR